MSEKKELNEVELKHVAGGKNVPKEPENNTDEAMLENLTDNKGSDD